MLPTKVRRCPKCMSGVSGVLPVSDDSGSSMKRRCRMSKVISKSSNCPDLINTGAMMRLSGATSDPTRPTRGACQIVAHQQLPQAVQCYLCCKKPKWFRGDCFQPCGCSLADSLLLLLTRSYGTKPSRYGGVFQETVFHNRVDRNVIVSFEEPISRESVGFRLPPKDMSLRTHVVSTHTHIPSTYTSVPRKKECS